MSKVVLYSDITQSPGQWVDYTKDYNRRMASAMPGTTYSSELISLMIQTLKDIDEGVVKIDKINSEIEKLNNSEGRTGEDRYATIDKRPLLDYKGDLENKMGRGGHTGGGKRRKSKRKSRKKSKRRKRSKRSSRRRRR